jgi:cytochrome oxidase Cu insertion factor (SCO1/SenC/PrrC family)
MSQAVRLVNISFDPERDTPVMMAGLEKQMKGTSQPENRVEWNFVTTPSVNHLLPLIDAFGQNVDIELDPKTGDQTLTYQHVLKVFLIDEKGSVREIYSTSYLDAEILLNDIKTLLLEQKDILN